MAFYQQLAEDLFSEFETHKTGLSSAESQKRLEKFGPNALLEKKKKPA